MPLVEATIEGHIEIVRACEADDSVAMTLPAYTIFHGPANKEQN
jgi:hypothetical protein